MLNLKKLISAVKTAFANRKQLLKQTFAKIKHFFAESPFSGLVAGVTSATMSYTFMHLASAVLTSLAVTSTLTSVVGWVVLLAIFLATAFVILNLYVCTVETIRIYAK